MPAVARAAGAGRPVLFVGWDGADWQLLDGYLSDGAMPNLAALVREGRSGVLKPMTAKDGPHYADNVKMDGPGIYRLTYSFTPPEANGFYRHVDKETGAPGWWQLVSETFTFTSPQK